MGDNESIAAGLIEISPACAEKALAKMNGPRGLTTSLDLVDKIGCAVRGCVTNCIYSYHDYRSR